MRGSQHWRIIAPEILQYCDIESNEETWSLDLAVKLLNPKISWDAWGKLARPVVSSPPTFDIAPYFAPASAEKGTSGRPAKKRRVVKKTGNVKTLSTLERLSNELLDMIVEQLELEKVDVIALGFSSQHLWEVVLRHIHTGYLKCAAPWAGKKIAFQGSYSTDLPETFMENGLAQSITGTKWFGNMCQARRFLWQHRVAPITPQSEEAGWVEAAQKHSLNSVVLASMVPSIEVQLGCSYLFPENQHWLLRNLTTHEFVSDEGWRVRTTRELRNGNTGLVNTLRFDDVLLMRTCWTSIPSHDEDSLNIHRAVWAGHRFDIVTAKAHRAEEKAEDWCDVTEAVVKEVDILRKKLDGARQAQDGW